MLGISLLLASGLARTASAQTGVGGSSGATALAAADLLIVVQSKPGQAIPDFDLQRVFNVSNCQCNPPVYVFFTFTQSGFAKKTSLGTGTIEFWAGLNCNSITLRTPQSCTKLGDTITLATFGAQGGVVVPTDFQTLSQNFGQPAVPPTTIGDGGVLISDGGSSGAVTATGVCAAGTAFSQTIWALVTFTGDAPYDVSATISVPIDTAPPPPPDNTQYSLTPGNEAIIANWAILDTSVNVDLLGYQLLCDRGGGLQVFPTGTFGAGFETCSTTTLPTGQDAHVFGTDANFACSPLLTTTASSFRIKILQNDIIYGVGLVAIDTHYNASVPLLHYQRPQRTLSFYDVYRNGDEANNMPGAMPDPGKATGGFCAIAGDTGRGAGVGGLAGIALAVGVGFAARRRRSPRR